MERFESVKDVVEAVSRLRDTLERLCLFAMLTCAACATSDASCTTDCPTEGAELRDLSDFTAFSVRREGVFVICPPVDQIIAASILSTRSGYLFAPSVLRPVAVEPADCQEPWIASVEFGCLAETELPEKLLTREEAESMLAAFGAVEILNADCAPIDPCWINTFRWDDFEVPDDFCTPLRITRSSSETLIGVLTELSGAF